MKRTLRQACASAGLEVVLHQPAEVRLFARLKRLRAKTDAIDARLIAAATAIAAHLGGSAPLAALLGGQVTAGISGYGEFQGQIESGDLRALAADAGWVIPREVVVAAMPLEKADGLRLALTVGAMLLAFISLIALLNAMIGGVGGWFGHPDLSFETIIGYVFAPIMLMIGVPWH